MPSGELYATYHLLGEPETTIEWSNTEGWSDRVSTFKTMNGSFVFLWAQDLHSYDIPCWSMTTRNCLQSWHGNGHFLHKDIGWAMAKVMWLRRIGSHLHTRNLVDFLFGVLGARWRCGYELYLVIVSWWIVVVFGCWGRSLLPICWSSFEWTRPL